MLSPVFLIASVRDSDGGGVSVQRSAGSFTFCHAGIDSYLNGRRRALERAVVSVVTADVLIAGKEIVAYQFSPLVLDV